MKDFNNPEDFSDAFLERLVDALVDDSNDLFHQLAMRMNHHSGELSILAQENEIPGSPLVSAHNDDFSEDFDQTLKFVEDYFAEELHPTGPEIRGKRSANHTFHDSIA